MLKGRAVVLAILMMTSSLSLVLVNEVPSNIDISEDKILNEFYSNQIFEDYYSSIVVPISDVLIDQESLDPVFIQNKYLKEQVEDTICAICH